MPIRLNKDHLKGFLTESDFQTIAPAVLKAHDALHHKKGAGAELTGWVDLPGRIPDSLVSDINGLARDVQKNSNALVSIGIGGSYLGIRAAEEFLKEDIKLPIYYAGQNLSSDYHRNLLKELKSKEVTAIVISKSGTTTEPALAFRIVKKFMENKYTVKEIKKRIICVTDEKKGALRQIAAKKGLKSFVIPDDVGGRFSVLTPVGLVPLALAGIDIKKFIEGARDAQKEFSNADLSLNLAYQYAAARFLLYNKGKTIEVLSTFYPHMVFVAEWWKQLFGESEAKDGKGIFPASLNLTADLHSLGQLMQEGRRNIFETFLMAGKSRSKISIPEDKEDWDHFNIVAGKDMDFVNKKAQEGTALAHLEGGVPNMTITVEKRDAYHLGELFYFFEKAVGISGYLLGVNPFNQPGVEAYKKKMFQLIGRIK